MELPARIGKYELQEFLGGGMSKVYRARDSVIGRIVAVKILTDSAGENEEARQRFLAEARMAGNISHENILRIYDFGEDEEHRPYMVMEFLKGENLRQAILSGHTGRLRDKINIATQLAVALAYIHELKIIHRDIKPENVNLGPGGTVKLMDFGIAKAQGVKLTRPGCIVGTPHYMAPEQFTEGEVTELTDVYSFGALLFELLTGVRLINGDTLERIVHAVVNEAPNLAPLQDPLVPQVLYDMVKSCTSKNPASRPRGFEAIREELNRLVADSEASTELLQNEKQFIFPKRRSWLQAAGLLMLAALAAGSYQAFRRVPDPPPTVVTVSGEMVLVPAGPFLFGEDRQKVSLPAFYIDKTEVTNAAYRRFSESTGRSLPPDFPNDKPNFPVVDVSFLDAHAFADWAGERLPSAQQWEKAARGPDGRLFPWGEGLDASRVNINSDGPRPVTDFPNGASKFGALNMVGNVWEFVDHVMTPTQEQLVQMSQYMRPVPSTDEPWYAIRGAAFNSTELTGMVLWEDNAVPNRYTDSNLGFRCVKETQ
jgi:serine/threonine protein kinase